MFLFLALAALLIAPIAACDSAAESLLPQQEKYDFTTSCEPQSVFEACSTCCTGLSFDTALLALGDCGCSYQYTDWEICKSGDGDINACFNCCTANDEGSAANVSQGECRCVGIQKTEPTEDRKPNKCEKAGDTCRCSRNTTGKCEAIGGGDPTLACGCTL